MEELLLKIRAFFLNATRYTLHASSGFTLLLAVLIGSLLFSMGLAIASITLKELSLSSAARESEKAFYAADSGVECALFWDIREGETFPTSNSDTKRRSKIFCSGETLQLTMTNETSAAATTTFTLHFAPRCAEVIVGKVARAGTEPEHTVIESRGRNDCDVRDNPRRVERALRVRY